MRILRLHVVAAMLALAFSATANADLTITAESISIPFSAADQSAFLEVFVQSDRAAAPDLFDWQITMLSPAPSITYLGGVKSVAHPYVLENTSTLFAVAGGSEFRALDSGFLQSEPLNDGDGLVRVNLGIAGGTAPGVYDISFGTGIDDTFLTGAAGDFNDVLTQSGTLTIIGGAAVTPVPLAGGGSTYRQNFDGDLGPSGAAGTSLPMGWSANVDGTPQSTISQDFPTGAVATGTYSAGNGPDRALGTGGGIDSSNELEVSLEVTGSAARAWRVTADIETWAAGAGASDPFDSGFQVSLIDGNMAIGLGTAQHSLAKPTDGMEIRDGNAAANRVRFDSGVVEQTIGVGSVAVVNFDARGIGNTADTIVGLDNVVVRAVAPGDVDGDGSVNPLDIVELLKGGQFGKGTNAVTWQQGDFNGDDRFGPLDLVAVLTFLRGQFPTTYASEQGAAADGTPDVIVDYTTGEVIVDFAGHTSSSVIIDSASGVFNGDAPAWDTMGEFRTASAAQLSNTMFNGTESGVDSLGNLIKAEFMNDSFDFNADLTVQLLVATPDGPVTVDGHVIVIPEPSTWMLLGLGSLALLAVVRRRIK